MDNSTLIRASILIVEEDTVIRRALRKLLEVLLPDCTFADADTDESAAALAQLRPPDVIMIDVAPPKANGFETVRSLRAAAPAATIVALTMEDNKSYQEAVLSAGASACIRIWEIQENLLPTLEDLLNNKYQELEKKTVVCVEDEVDMIDLVRLILERHEVNLIGALGGREALRTIRRVKPDLVLLDLMMPDLNGWEIYRQMKADRTTRDIPIIVITVLDRQWSKRQGLDPGEVEGYMVKPFVPKELVKEIERALRPSV